MVLATHQLLVGEFSSLLFLGLLPNPALKVLNFLRYGVLGLMHFLIKITWIIMLRELMLRELGFKRVLQAVLLDVRYLGGFHVFLSGLFAHRWIFLPLRVGSLRI